MSSRPIFGECARLSVDFKLDTFGAPRWKLGRLLKQDRKVSRLHSAKAAGPHPQVLASPGSSAPPAEGS